MAEVSVCHRSADAKAIFNRAVDDDVLVINPFDRLRVRGPRPDKCWHYVSVEELEKLLGACPSTGWKALIALCRLAGLRRGEALELPCPCHTGARSGLLWNRNWTPSFLPKPLIVRLAAHTRLKSHSMQISRSGRPSGRLRSPVDSHSIPSLSALVSRPNSRALTGAGKYPSVCFMRCKRRENHECGQRPLTQFLF